MRLLKNQQGRVAVELDANPKFCLLLHSVGGRVDVERVTEREFNDERWMVIENQTALDFALTYGPSFLPKSSKAVHALLHIYEMLDEQPLEELLRQWHRLGKNTSFDRKEHAITAILEAAPIINAEVQPEEENQMSTQPATFNGTTVPANPNANPEVVKAVKGKAAKSAKTTAKVPAKKTTAKVPAKKATPVVKTTAKPAVKTTAKTTGAKKAGKPRGVPSADAIAKAKKVCASDKGSGGLIRTLLKDGKLDTDAILSKVAKAFPDRNTSASDVAWNKSMMVKAGILKS